MPWQYPMPDLAAMADRLHTPRDWGLGICFSPDQSMLDAESAWNGQTVRQWAAMK